MIVLVENNQRHCTLLDDGKVVGTQLNTAGVSYTLLPWLPLLLCSVKYEEEETFEHQQTKEWSREHNIC